MKEDHQNKNHKNVICVNRKDSHTYAIFLLAGYCMPTLLKIKPSSLISVNKKMAGEKQAFFDIIETEIKQFNSSYYILYEDVDRINLLIYNEDLLNKLLTCRENEQFFRSYGYNSKAASVKSVLQSMKQRFDRYYSEKITLKDGGLVELEPVGFPHEIGVILGYPRKDVEDFVRYKGKNYTLCGYWKVYHNVEEAIKIFENYQKIREYAVGMLLEGKKLNNMIATDLNIIIQ